MTGTGKTRLGIAAIAEAHRDGYKSVVLVPSIPLQAQWTSLIAAVLPDLRIGRWGNGHDCLIKDCDVVVSVVNSALRHLPELRTVGLIVADEVHHYGSRRHSKTLVPVGRRLALTATLERSDEGVDKVLVPYFGQVVFRMGYGQALKDRIVAPFTIQMVGLDFAQPSGRDEYDRLTRQMDEARDSLVKGYRYPYQPGAFMLAAMNSRADWQSREGMLCARYRKAFVARRNLLASDPAKVKALSTLSSDILAANGCLVFTETVEAAEACALALSHAGLNAGTVHSRLKPRERAHRLSEFRGGQLHALVAPKVLDEGVDLPHADLGIIVSASRSKRQMIQRMGRILRPKSDGRMARFVILYLRDTGEDPVMGAHEAFLDEVLTHARRD